MAWGKKKNNPDTPAGGGRQRMTCPTCNGNRLVESNRAGAKPGDTEICRTCDGDGKIWGPPA